MGEKNRSKGKFVFWADLVAESAIEHAKRNGMSIVTVKSGGSPSGGKHIGNMNDQIRAFFIYDAVVRKGIPARLIYTNDDMDPLRTIPPSAPDGDGEWHSFTQEELSTLEKYLGWPYCRIPDVFGCHKSWSEHFNSVIRDGLSRIGISMENYNNSDSYANGGFLEITKFTLSKVDQVRGVLSRYQKTLEKDWIPFHAICENCGKITTTAISFNLEDDTVEYECRGRILAGKYVIKGCGHKGVSTFKEGKLPWRIEWVAQWKIFQVNAEPFGKDHYEGSWKSGQALAREIYGIEPPANLVYEFFLVNGEKMSSRKGNAYIIQDLLKVLEPEVVKYLYTKRPMMQRNIDLKNLHLLVEEFDRFEESFFKKSSEEAERIYPVLMGGIPNKKPLRINYLLASYLVQFYPVEEAYNSLVRAGIIGEGISEDDRNRVLLRLRLAKNWLSTFADSSKYVLKREFSKVDLNDVKKALKDLSERLSSLTEFKGEAIQNIIYSTARENNIPAPEFFRKLYLIFLGLESGPRLGYLLATLGREKVISRLETAIGEAG
ncbi:MAG: lysine--tRNA ligase [Thermoproteota archaeon]|nr:lysine--tRNA ligase [Candidatus Brockarchaeota archaeon]